MNAKKRLLWTCIAIVIATLSIYAVVRNSGGVSPEELLETLQHAHPAYLAAAVLCMLGFIVFESEALLCLLRGLGFKRSRIRGLLYSAGDIYFSAITPSASGGQPVSAYFMHADHIPGAVVTVVLVTNLVAYTLALLAIGIFCLVLNAGVFVLFTPLSKVLIIGGLLILLGLAILFYGLLRKSGILRSIGNAMIGMLARMRLMRHPDKWRERLERHVEEFRECAQAMTGQKKTIILAFLFDLLQRVSQISVSLMAFHAIGGAETKGFDLWTVQAFSQVGSSCLPVPGGMGVADFLMLDGFKSMMERDAAYQLEMISRGLSFYLCVILSAAIAFAGYLALRRRRRKERTEKTSV